MDNGLKNRTRTSVTFRPEVLATMRANGLTISTLVDKLARNNMIKRGLLEGELEEIPGEDIEEWKKYQKSEG